MKEHPYASFLHKVEKPARYIGGEYNSIPKDWSQVDATMALCFPDLYDIGMSHLGTKILYSIVNKTEDLCLERAFCPWPDMEEELRQRDLPLLSLETHQPLHAFDVVGFSLQYELTFTNIFTMLDLGRIPLRAEERTLADPLVIAGGPVATHPEPIAPFIDAFLVGDAEERLPRLLRHYKQLKQEGKLDRMGILAALAAEGGLYCPALYERSLCERSSMLVIDAPKHPEAPVFVERAFLEDISRYQFPDDSPVAVAEAIFDRMSIEIARGCTEGCRFCQAGMIYRPVRERGPEEIIETLTSALEKGGYDEAAITSLSTADYSCISPLITGLMQRLREKKISLGISSLRAYGLDEPLLDEIASVKATGLTFAPEAGTQRMRDVVNKNVTEDDIFTTCHRVFSRGWNKMKLYFMIGLPTEEDEDVIGIAKMGRQAYEIGKLYQQKRVQVVVSVSSHVPKPHTPFQWAAMDSMDQIDHKQEILFSLSKKWNFKFRRHDKRVSHIEGIIARGDIRVATLLEDVWRKGARFDGWDEQLDWDLWQESIAAWEQEHQLDRQLFLGTIPLDGRLPWDHIDVGLDEGFLAKEYKKSLAGRLSPPCGKPFGEQVHHTNLQDARAEDRNLVCYHCGIACDLSQMRQERIDYLEEMNAELPLAPKEGPNAHENALSRLKQGKTPHDFQQGKKHRYRLRYTKLLPVSLQGHHDLLRIMPRIMHRANLPIYYSEGFNPRPILSFGPALSLGIRSLAEYVDVTLSEAIDAPSLLERLNSHTPEGLYFTAARCLTDQTPSVSKRLNAKEYAVVLPKDFFLLDEQPLTPENLPEAVTRLQKRCDELLQQETIPITVQRKEKVRTLDLKEVIMDLSVMSSDQLPDQAAAPDTQLVLRLLMRENNGPTIRPLEAVAHLFHLELDFDQILRLGCWYIDKEEQRIDPVQADLPGPHEPHTLCLSDIDTAQETARGNQLHPQPPSKTLSQSLQGDSLQQFLQS